MDKFKKILSLENQIEAKLLESILKERGIPHMIRSYHDTAYDGLFQSQKGWGRLDAPAEYEDEIKEIYDELPDRQTGE